MRRFIQAADIDVGEQLSARIEPFMSVQLKLATPMMGGGAKAHDPDAHWPIRSSAVRGHLRFWWRASAGALLPSIQAMREKEAELWGSDQRHGKIGLRVVVGTRGERFRIVEDPRLSFKELNQAIQYRHIPAYALGPANSRENLLEIWFLQGCTFTVELAANPGVDLTPADLAEARAALKLWVMFGGVGSRTRRGFGALALETSDPELNSVPLRLADKALCATGTFTHLHGAKLVVSGKPMTAMDAWAKAIERYKHFRKGEAPGRGRPYNGPSSHSPWPEANSIRDVLGIRALTPPGSTAGLDFPRAKFGLPLQFGSMPQHSGSFGHALLELEAGATRMASIVIVRPFFVNGKWRAGVLKLKQPSLKAGKLRLRVGHNAFDGLSTDGQLQSSQWFGEAGPPPTTSVIEQFMDYLKFRFHNEEPWVEVPIR